MPKLEEIDYNAIYPSNYGGVQVVEDLGWNSTHTNRWVKIKFLESGNIQEAELCNVKRGNIRDRQRFNIVGQVFHSRNYGDFIVLEKLGLMGGTNTMNRIRFLKTGYETNASTTCIKTGNVKDPFYPNVYGVGYVGDIKFPSRNPLYAMWGGMLRRAYGNEECYRKAYANVFVCDRWHYFGNFIADAPYLPGYKEWQIDMTYQHALDKDMLQLCLPPESPRYYSPDTCCFIPVSINSMIVNNSNKFIVHPVGIYTDTDRFYLRPIINGQIYNWGEYCNYDTAITVYNNRCIFYGLHSMIIPHNNPVLNPIPVQPRNMVTINKNTI